MNPPPGPMNNPGGSPAGSLPASPTISIPETREASPPGSPIASSSSAPASGPAPAPGAGPEVIEMKDVGMSQWAQKNLLGLPTSSTQLDINFSPAGPGGNYYSIFNKMSS